MTPQVLPVRSGIDAEARRQLSAQVRLLRWFSAAWLCVAGPVAVLAGAVASSVALIGFGIDIAIAGFATTALLWRLASRRRPDPILMLRAQRVLAFQFIVLAPLLAFESLHGFLADEHAETSALGIAISTFSLVAMLGLGAAKRRIGILLGSSTLRTEARDDSLLGRLALVLALALLANAVAGIWWLDPLAGLLIACLSLWQGFECWFGTGWGSWRETAEEPAGRT